MNQKERMLNALPYKAWLDGLEEERDICKQLVYEFNLEVGENFLPTTTSLSWMWEKSPSEKMHKSLPMYRFTRQDTLSTRKAAIPVMNTESPLRLAIMYG